MKPKKKPARKSTKAKEINFRVHLRPGLITTYFEVHIHTTKKGMLKAKKEAPKDCEAFYAPDPVESTLTVTKDGSEFYVGNPKIGDLHFHNGNFDMSLVVHELFHATLSLSRKMNCWPNQQEQETYCGLRGPMPDNEELCASINEALVYQFMRECPLKIKV
jgi:hypothetical protein